MKTELTFDPEFEQLYKSWCNDPTMAKMLELSGIAIGQVDIGAMSHKYFQKSWQEDGTIDHNANSNNLGPINYGLEIAKPTMKLLGLYLLHRYLRKDHPLDVANDLLTDVVTGEYYVHDSSGIGIQIPYCYAWSTMWVAENGIPYGQLPSLPPKHARSFVGQVAEVTMDLSQEFAGAVAPADILIVYSYFAKKEELTDKEIQNDLQSFVHIVNKQFRPGGQSPFTNLSILDKDNIESLFGDAIFPDGSKLDIDYALHVQDVFLDWFSEGNPTTNEPYRFPVTTMNVTKDEEGKVIDLDFLFKLAVYNTKLGAFNIHSGERAKLAMCPLHGDEQVLIRNHKGIFDSRIGDLGNHGKTDYEVMINGRFESGKFVKTHTDSFIEVTLSNGHKFKTTPEHLNVTKRGTLMSKDLVVGDLIPFSLTPYVGEGGDYHMGLMVGAYLGDGSVDGRTVTFSLNHTTKAELFDILESYINNTLGGKTRTVERDNVKLLETNSNVVHGILSQFVYGNDKALKKGMLPEVYEKSLEFRKGVYDGYYATDGGNKDRIYTSSERMVHDLSVLAATMGTVTNIKNIDEREGGYSDKPNYCVKTYNRNGLLNRSYAGVWESDVDKVWFYITDIHTIDKAGPAYCFEMNTEEHLFQLSNGMITHNCRFINDPETMSHFKTDTFGNGGLNIGSHRIVAMNMPRYAYMADGINSFLRILEERMERAAKILVTHRERILKKRIEQGFLRAFQVGIADLSTMFSTIGVTGMPEAIETLGHNIILEDGYSINQTAVEVQVLILERMEAKRKELSERYGVPFNIEEVPGESAAINLRDKDEILFEGNIHPNRLYSNQFIPVTYPLNKKDRIEATGMFMKYMTGGSILHMNVDEAIKDPMIMFELMKYMIESGVDHFAINYGFSRCCNGHSCTGIHTLCPECLAEIKDYLTRIVGYFVPVSSWNKIRQTFDFSNRVKY